MPSSIEEIYNKFLAQIALNPQRNGFTREEAFSLRSHLSLYLSYYQNHLLLLDNNFIYFFNEQQKNLVKERLIYTLFLLRVQLEIHTANRNSSGIEEMSENIATCNQRLNDLITPPNPFEPIMPEATLSIWTKLYLKCKNLITYIRENLLTILGSGNIYRLYLVWGNSTLVSILETMGKWVGNFGEVREALPLADKIGKVSSHLGWIYLYLRLAIVLGEFGLTLIKNIAAKASNSKVIKEQTLDDLHLRLVYIFNDIIWGTVNLLTAFIFLGSGIRGYIGNLLTLPALLMDYAVTCYLFEKKRTQYHEEIRKLNASLVSLRTELDALPENDVKKEWLQAQIQDHEALIEEKRFDFKFEKRKYYNDILFFGGTFLSFLMISLFLMPATWLPAALVSGFVLTGSFACFFLMSLNSVVGDFIDYTKASKKQKILENKLTDLTTALQSETDPYIKVQLVAEKRRMQIQIAGLREEKTYQKIRIAPNAIMHTAVPALILFSLVFIPFPGNIAVMACTTILALLIKEIAKIAFKPKSASKIMHNTQHFFPKKFATNKTPTWTPEDNMIEAPAA